MHEKKIHKQHLKAPTVKGLTTKVRNFITFICTQFSSARIVNARYAWLLYGWYSEEWWRSVDDISCSEDELVAVLERALVVQQYPIADTSDGAVDRLVRSTRKYFYNNFATMKSAS